MRSLLFVPADSPRKLARALDAGADVLLLDLEDSVAPGDKPKARELAGAFLRENLARAARSRLFVRVNALDTGLAQGDLDGVIAAGAEGIMLPKSGSGADVARLAEKIGAREAKAGAVRRAEIVAIAAETAASLFGLGSYAGASDRLTGMTWGSEDLSVS